MSKPKSNASRRAENLAASERAAAIRREQQRKEQRRRTIVVTIVIGVVLALILAIYYAVQSKRDTTGQATTPPAGVIGQYGVPRGPASAPVKVTIYEDFMCPFCGELEAASRSTLEKYVAAGKVQIDYRVLAFLDRASSSEYSTRAMNALGVVLDTAGPQVAAKFHDLLYEHQPQEGSSGLSNAQLVDYAVQAGADRSKVQGPIDAVKYRQWVKNATGAASQAGVNQTPTVLVNGKQVQFQTIPQLVAEIESAIQKGSGG